MRGDTLQACGYYAFHKLVQSPHHALWIDISLEHASGCKLQTSTPAAAQRLQLKDPRGVNKNKIKFLKKSYSAYVYLSGCSYWRPKYVLGL
jgi:hypothetical protein